MVNNGPIVRYANLANGHINMIYYTGKRAKQPMFVVYECDSAGIDGNAYVDRAMAEKSFNRRCEGKNIIEHGRIDHKDVPMYIPIDTDSCISICSVNERELPDGLAALIRKHVPIEYQDMNGEMNEDLYTIGEGPDLGEDVPEQVVRFLHDLAAQRSNDAYFRLVKM